MKYTSMTLDYERRPWLAPKPCNGAIACDKPTKLYAAGWRCDEHPPASPDDTCFIAITGRLFDGTEFTR